MNLVILIGLAAIGILHAVRGAIAVLRSDRITPLPAARRALLPLAGVALSIVGLLVGWSAGLPVPVGYAGGAGGLLLDPIGGVFTLLLLIAAAWCDADDPFTHPEAGLRDLRVAATMLAFLAGDAFLLACGACLAILLPQRLLGHRTLRRSVLAAFAIAGACCLLSGPVAPAAGLLADPGFVLLRAAGGIATLLLPVLVMLAAMPLLGLWPMGTGFRRRCAFAPVWVPIFGLLLGLFLPVRLLLDLGGPVSTVQGGTLLVLLGAGSAAGAAWSGVSERSASGVVGSVLASQAALAVLAVGFCLLARSNDLSALAGSAFDAVMLILPVCVLGGLCCLGLVRAMEREAGSGLLSRSGGLVRSMPFACATLLLPLALLGAVPPLGGFASLWLLVQLVLATPLPMLGGVAVPSLLLLLLIGVVAALVAACWLRLGVVALLGRPRTPRGAAATDLKRPVLRRSSLLLLLPLLASLLPGLWLRLANGPVADPSASVVDVPQRPLFWLDAPAGNAIMFPLPVALLLTVCAIAAVLVARALLQRPEKRRRGWDGGNAAPPPWLPFGDPATQIAPATLSLSLQQALCLPPVLLRRSGTPPGLGTGAAQASIRHGRRFGAVMRTVVLHHGPELAAIALLAVLCVAAGAVLAPVAVGPGR